MRLHITSTAGIGVVAPDAADISGALKDDEVFDSFLFQTDSHAYSAEATANNCDLRFSQVAFTYDVFSALTGNSRVFGQSVNLPFQTLQE
jgi:hypothetical protein